MNTPYLTAVVSLVRFILEIYSGNFHNISEVQSESSRWWGLPYKGAVLQPDHLHLRVVVLHRTGEYHVMCVHSHGPHSEADTYWFVDLIPSTATRGDVS